MAEEKSREAPGVGLSGGSPVDAGAGKSIPANPCWVCGEPLGPTYRAMSIRRRSFQAYTEPVTDMTRLPLMSEVVHLHHSCYDAAKVMAPDL